MCFLQFFRTFCVIVLLLLLPGACALADDDEDFRSDWLEATSVTASDNYDDYDDVEVF